jgi:hypothetical protein
MLNYLVKPLIELNFYHLLRSKMKDNYEDAKENNVYCAGHCGFCIMYYCRATQALAPSSLAPWL